MPVQQENVRKQMRLPGKLPKTLRAVIALQAGIVLRLRPCLRVWNVQLQSTGTLSARLRNREHAVVHAHSASREREREKPLNRKRAPIVRLGHLGVAASEMQRLRVRIVQRESFQPIKLGRKPPPAPNVRLAEEPMSTPLLVKR